MKIFDKEIKLHKTNEFISLTGVFKDMQSKFKFKVKLFF